MFTDRGDVEEWIGTKVGGVHLMTTILPNMPLVDDMDLACRLCGKILTREPIDAHLQGRIQDLRKGGLFGRRFAENFGFDHTHFRKPRPFHNNARC